MEFKNNSSQSGQAPRRTDTARAGETPQTYQSEHRSRSGKFSLKSLLIVVIIVVLVAGMVGAVAMWRGGENSMTDVKKSQYQAVFLTNGQVYFGKIASMKRGELRLTNIYYLQVQQNVQPSNNNSNNNSQVSLAKLGNELHGPEDSMYIARDQVLFWENLKDSGKVVQAIKSSGQK